MSSSREIFLALVHHPVLGRGGELLTTTLTNIDVHDLARSARTFGVAQFFVVHPLESQQYLAGKILDHWVNGPGGKRIPDRATALKLVTVVSNLEQAKQKVADTQAERGAVEIWATAARPPKERKALGFAEARQRLAQPGPPILLLLGTGWGLADAILDQADEQLEPLDCASDTGFNHLSVRAAGAICFDRLLGAR